MQFMPSKKSRALYEIRDSILSAQQFTEGYDHDRFIVDRKTFLATTRLLEIISEAAVILNRACMTETRTPVAHDPRHGQFHPARLRQRGGELCLGRHRQSTASAIDHDPRRDRARRGAGMTRIQRKLPHLANDAEAEGFLTKADLSQYDLSPGEMVQRNFEQSHTFVDNHAAAAETGRIVSAVEMVNPSVRRDQ